MTVYDQGSGGEDSELVCRAKNGDGGAFDHLMLRHQGAVSSHMRRYTRVIAEVEELTQTVFVKAYMSLDTYKAIAPFANWLRTIATRVGYDYWRQKKNRRNFVLLPDMDFHARTEQDSSEKFAEFDRLAKVLERLCAEDRQVLYMLYVDEIGVAEIAETMGWNLSMTKMRAFRARKKLKKFLEAGE